MKNANYTGWNVGPFGVRGVPRTMDHLYGWGNKIPNVVSDEFSENEFEEKFRLAGGISTFLRASEEHRSKRIIDEILADFCEENLIGISANAREIRVLLIEGWNPSHRPYEGNSGVIPVFILPSGVACCDPFDSFSLDEQE